MSLASIHLAQLSPLTRLYFWSLANCVRCVWVISFWKLRFVSAKISFRRLFSLSLFAPILNNVPSKLPTSPSSCCLWNGNESTSLLLRENIQMVTLEESHGSACSVRFSTFFALPRQQQIDEENKAINFGWATKFPSVSPPDDSTLVCSTKWLFFSA